MTSVKDGARGTASLTEERDPDPFQRRDEFDIGRLVWPRIGTSVAFSPFGEETVVDFMGAGWSTNAKARPLFAGQGLMQSRRPSVWEKLARLRTMIPSEERQRYPVDGSLNLDRYVYGSSAAE